MVCSVAKPVEWWKNIVVQRPEPSNSGSVINQLPDWGKSLELSGPQTFLSSKMKEVGLEDI